jgi:tetratricopeptide (TPR) repeat protein
MNFSFVKICAIFRFSVALDASDTAIQYDSTDTSYFCHRGLIQKKLDNYFKAAADFRQAIKLDPHNQAAREMLDRL